MFVVQKIVENKYELPTRRNKSEHLNFNIEQRCYICSLKYLYFTFSAQLNVYHLNHFFNSVLFRI